MRWLLAPIFAMLFASQALAQQACGPANVFTELLWTRHGETPVFEAILQKDGRPDVPIVWFLSPAGTWTLAENPVPGILCMRDKGISFEWPDRKPPPGKPT